MRQIEKIDKAFEYVLLLVGVLASGLFEFSVYLESKELVMKEAPIFLFRAFFTQLSLLVLLWFCSIFVKKTKTRIWLRLSSWAFGTMILRLILVAFVNLGFVGNHAESVEKFWVFNIVSLASSIMLLLALYFILKSYMVPLGKIQYFRSKRWALIIGASWAFFSGISYGITLPSTIELVPIPIQSVFTGLLPLLIGVFAITVFFFSELRRRQ
jgi:hypothetical protein